MKKGISLIILITLLLSVCSFPTVYADDSYFSAQIAEIKALIVECEYAGFDCDYEHVNLAALERFAGYIEEDIQTDFLDTRPDSATGKMDAAQLLQLKESMIRYNKSCMDNIYTETKNNLVGYLAGEKTPLQVSPLAGGGSSVNGANLVHNGQQVFSVGYGHGGQSKRDIGVLRSFGADNIQLEAGPQPVMTDSDVPSWKINDVNMKAIVEVTGEEHSSGTKALRICGTDENGEYTSINQTVLVEPEKEYTVSFKMKRSPYALGVYLSALIHDRIESFTPTVSWETYSFDYTPDTYNYSIPFYLKIFNKGNVYIDDICIAEKGTNKNCVLNNSFEDKFEASNIIYVFDALRYADKNNIAVSFLLSPHIFPTDLSPEIYGDTLEMIRYNINAPVAKELIEGYLRFLLPYLKRYSSVHNICLTNEPIFETSLYPDFYNPQFRDYLIAIHGDFDSIKRDYGTYAEGFLSLDEITMPESPEQTPLYYDWVQFNTKITAQWHEWMADIVREYLPDIPLHSKICNYMDNYWKFMRFGVDAEVYGKFLDFAGNDAVAYVEEPGSFLNKMAWYDYQYSVVKKPIYNSEDHIIRDRSILYDERQANHLRSDLWQGAIHGRAMSTIWTWERSYDFQDARSGSILTRPDCVVASGKTSLDMNRLSNQVSQIVNAIPKAAIFFSKASEVYDQTAHIASLMESYKTLVTSGQRVGFVTETSLELLNQYKLLIVPESQYTTKSAINAIADFQKAGGKVVILGDQSLRYDEYMQPNTYPENLKVSVVKDSLRYDTVTKQAVSELGLRKVRIVDNNTGRGAENVEFEYFIGDDAIINICNLTHGDSKNLSVYVDGKKAENITEMISNQKYVGSIESDGYKPLLIRIDSYEETNEMLQRDRADNPWNVQVSDGGELTWDTDNVMYDKAQIYDIYNGYTYVASTNDKRYLLSNEGTYLISVIDKFGRVSSGTHVSYTNDKPFIVNITELSILEDTIKCSISIQNISSKLQSGYAMIMVKDSDGNIISNGASRALYRPNSIKGVSVKLGNCKDAATVEIVVKGDRFSVAELSEKKTVFLDNGI